MKKQYIKPFVQIDDVEVDYVFLAGSGEPPTPPASGVRRFIDETDLGLSPDVIGGDYTGEEEFIEGE